MEDAQLCSKQHGHCTLGLLDGRGPQLDVAPVGGSLWAWDGRARDHMVLCPWDGVVPVGA